MPARYRDRRLKPRGANADLLAVRSAIGIPGLLVALVVGGVLFMLQAKSSGPTAPQTQQVETQAVQAVSSVNFGAADELARAWYGSNGTYAGFTLDPSYQVTVERADATGYCLQGGAGTAVEHEDGPGGSAQPGPC